MKKVIVNIEEKTVTVNNQTCNFYEAGLETSGELITDKYEIIEHLTEREGVSESQVTFE